MSMINKHFAGKNFISCHESATLKILGYRKIEIVNHGRLSVVGVAVGCMVVHSNEYHVKNKIPI